ncbi:uncharacterized protein [Palaemon carinicauda]|uniref:uncharacterized protein n=1 Tax=Palaemon carinicauda TaxID=392227 RepID=UPI0035B65D10
MASFMELPERRMPKEYSEADFCYSKLFRCVNKVGASVLCDVARAMYSHTSMNSNGGSKTLRQYMADEKWGRRKIKAVFDKDHFYLFDLDLNKEDFDITFANGVIEDVCKDLYDKLSDKGKMAIEEFRELRNKVCHKYGVTSSELSPLVEYMKGLLKDIYLNVGNVVSQDFSDNISAMEDSLECILSIQIYQVDSETYLEDVKEFKDNLRFKMIEEGKRELHSAYSRLQIRNPCFWMAGEDVKKTTSSRYQVDTIFTPLDIEFNGKTIGIAEIFTVTGKMKGPKRKPLVFCGLAGSGKTFLCHYVIHEWCKKESDQKVIGLNKFDLIIYVEVGKVKSQTLLEFLTEECLLETCMQFQTDDIISTLKELEILIMVDGFEEAEIGKSLDLVRDIFYKLSDQCILFTTLPEYKEDILCIYGNCKVSSLPGEMYIHGFDENVLKTFSEKVFAAVEKDEVKREEELCSFLEYMETTRKVIGRHLKLPLTLSLLICLWRVDSKSTLKIVSSTLLYQEIFKLSQRRFCELLEKKNRSDTLEKDNRKKLNFELEKILFCLGQQAWLKLLGGDIKTLTNMEIESLKEECCRSVDEDVLDFLSSFLYWETEGNISMQNRFAFLHKTQMEYLAGAYLADSVTLGSYKKLSFKDIDAELKQNHHFWENLLEIIKYITGCLAITDNFVKYEKEIFEILDKANIPSTDYNFWWSFYTETLKNESAGRKIIDKLPRSHWTLNDKHVVSALKFYRDFDVNLETLKIEIPAAVNPYDIKDLLPTLREVKCCKSEYTQANRKTDPVMIELSLLNHERIFHSRLSDDLVLSLNPWGCLTSFTGGLGEQEVLSSCHDLETIYVRLNTVNAVKAFKRSLSKIHKTVKKLHMTLGVSFSCSPSELCDLKYTENFELKLLGTKDEHKEWIKRVAMQINGRNGCHKLTLWNTEVTFETICYLIDELKDTVHEKISLNIINMPTAEELEELGKFPTKDFIEFV